MLLFTGGLDSTALAYRDRPDLTLTIDYGQRPAQGEIRAARAIARELELQHEVIRVDASAVGSGPLAGGSPLSSEMPPEWWPYRNQLLVTLAAMHIAPNGGGTLLIGTVAGDSAHCDGKPEFVSRLNELLKGQRPYTSLEAPALHMSATELLRSSRAPLALLGWTFSCHADSVPCGECRGCTKHIETLREVYPDAC